MKKLYTLTFFLFSFFIQAQEKHYAIGDTIFYYKGTITDDKICSSYYSIIKEKEDIGKEKKYKMYGFQRLKDTAKYFLHSEYETKFIEVQTSDGFQKFYHKNGNIASEGKTKNGRAIGLWRHWYKDGKIMDERLIPERVPLAKVDKHYTIKNFWNKEGVQTVIDGNGTFELKKDSVTNKGFYKNGKRHGKFSGFINNKKYYEEYYNNGKLISGVSWGENNKKFKYKEVFSNPRYKKGQESIKNLLAKNFDIPKYAYEKKIEGRILISFRVKKDGEIDNIKVAKSLCNPCDDEAIRVVKMMKKWKPAKYRGQHINIRYTLPISYKL